MRAVVASVLVLAACSDGDEDAVLGTEGTATTRGTEGTATTVRATEHEAGDYAAAVAAVLVDATPPLTPDVADCSAEALVGAVGADVLNAARVTPEELAAAGSLAGLDVDLDLDRDAVADALTAGLEPCGLAPELTASFVETLRTTTPGGPTSERAVDCLTAHLDARAAAYYAASFVEPDPELARTLLSGAVGACPAAFADLMAAAAAAQSGQEVLPEYRACLEDLATGDPTVGERLISGEREQAEEVIAEASAACPRAY